MIDLMVKEKMYVVVQIEKQIDEYVANIDLLLKYIKNLKRFQNTKEVTLSTRKKLSVEIAQVQSHVAYLADKLAGLYAYLVLDENEYLNLEENTK